MNNQQQNELYKQSSAVPTVHLRAAPIPSIGFLALHLYFVVSSGQHSKWERWEVWQHKNVFSRRNLPRKKANKISDYRAINPRQEAYGHLHFNLMHPLSGVGGGPSFMVQRWSGEAAEKFIAAIHKHAENYISRNRYLVWLGPNSNTYIARIINYAGVHASLPGTAIGKDWEGIFNFKFSLDPWRLIFQTPLIGVKISLTEDLELNLLGGTILGINFRFQELKFPLGRGIIKLSP
ncbi:MAG: DUF3750 domain-containing protein [Hormoscilla sp. SP5CHS1]|nr:DUF3750 domain-containing protein [Hormoscilla sp. SP5CHS1]